MATSILDRLSFDNRRAVANAGRESERRRSERELVEQLAASVARRDAARILTAGGSRTGTRLRRSA